MTGIQTTPDAVQRTYFAKSIVTGPLSRLMTPCDKRLTGKAPIRAIWRNEAGTAKAIEHVTPERASL